MKIRKHLTGLAIFLAVFGITSLAIADDHWSDDWRIEVDGRAKSAGTMSFTLTFEPGEEGTGAEPVTIDVQVPAKAKDNDVAEMITNTFRAVLGDDDYKVKQSWGENVLVKARGDTPDLTLELTGNTVQGISLEIDD